MNTGRFLLAALAASATVFAVGAVFCFGVPVVAPNIEPQFKNLALYRDWNGWTSTCMLLHPLVCGVVFAGVYAAARRDEHAAGEGGRAGHAESDTVMGERVRLECCLKRFARYRPDKTASRLSSRKLFH